MAIPKDENRIPVLAGVSDVDEETVISVAVNPDTDGAGTHGIVLEVS